MPANLPTSAPASTPCAPTGGGLPRDIEWRLPRHPRTVGRARELLRSQARSWHLAVEPVDTAVLLLSELVTNAVRHAGSPGGREISVRVIAGEKRLRIEVSDASDRPLRPVQLSDADESGRGLGIVAALADDWGTHPRPCGIGKTVWFEVGTGP